MRGRRCVAVILVLASLTMPAVRGQETTPRGEGRYPLTHQPDPLVPEVAFLSQAPIIDGLLDAGLELLPVGGFAVGIADGRGPEVDVADLASVQAAVPTYRVAYGTDFFYLYIEAPGDRLHFRDRAYQNGDGFALVLGTARPGDAATDEYYVLACSAVDDTSPAWTRHIFWCYNHDTFIPTSDATQLEFEASGGRIRFELYLPWSDLHPYHPWFSEGIGFNLRFVEAKGEGARYNYEVVPDEVGAANRPHLYTRLFFAPPRVVGPPQTFFMPERNNIERGETLPCRAVTAAAGNVAEELAIRIGVDLSGNEPALRTRYDCSVGITRHAFELNTAGLDQGSYTLEAAAHGRGAVQHAALSVLPALDFAALAARVEALAGRISAGSQATLAWYVGDVQRALAEVRDYETCETERKTIERILERIPQAEQGQDVYATRTGFFRRAFRSRVDNSLQPYTVIVPEDLDRSRRYPLIVFLHGSESDETDLGGFMQVVPAGCIGLGPRARGPSNLYCLDHAQTDIVEAIDDVMAHYPIDPRRVVLTGFSMGGYGVYRTFFETPSKYCALAVLSGAPYFGSDADGRAESSVPVLDFRRPENLGPFRGIPIFIHHGQQDRNCPYETTLALVKALQAAGARVEFISDPKLGHQAPSDEDYGAYRRWLAAVLADE